MVKMKLAEILKLPPGKEKAKHMIDLFDRSTEYLNKQTHERQLELEQEYSNVVDGLTEVYNECFKHNFCRNAVEFYEFMGIDYMTRFDGR